MLRFMVAAGEGVSLVPALAARALDRPDGLTVSSPIPDPAIGRDVVLASRRSDQRQFYIDHLTKLIRALAPGLMPEAQINGDGTPHPPANRAPGLKHDKNGIV